MEKIQTFLWFDNNAEDAANFYISVFKSSKIVGGMPETKEHNTKGKPMGVTVSLEGREFILFNGGKSPQEDWKFNGATSFFINCETQQEVDHYWDKLSDGGHTLQCGWLTDKFGITWQIVPTILGKVLGDPDREKASRAMQAMMKMTKLDIAGLQKAFDGE
jgi:predicted 3-demethylubiquinone-9 3-methyltransferase (glyoxalase superfamily)